MKEIRDRKVHIALSEDVHKRLRVKCALDDQTIQEYVSQLIEDSLKGVKIIDNGKSLVRTDAS